MQELPFKLSIPLYQISYIISQYLFCISLLTTYVVKLVQYTCIILQSIYFIVHNENSNLVKLITFMIQLESHYKQLF